MEIPVGSSYFVGYTPTLFNARKYPTIDCSSLFINNMVGYWYKDKKCCAF